MAVSRPTLLIQRILSFRELSPLLVVTDDVFQSGRSVIRLFEDAASKAGVKVISVGWQKTCDVCTMSSEALDQLPTIRSLDQVLKDIERLAAGSSKVLIALHELNDFLTTSAGHLSTLLSSLLAIHPGRISVIALHHADIPLLSYPAHLPSPQTLLSFLATTLIRCRSTCHVRLEREAAGRARTSAITLDLEGKDIFLPREGCQDVRVFLEVEHRRRSGRGVQERCVLDTMSGKVIPEEEEATLKVGAQNQEATATTEEDEIPFKLSLSEKEKADREGVVLPHFNMQDLPREAMQGGHIYYEPDSGDDFDMEDPDDDLLL